jgi:hypothetical protein
MQVPKAIARKFVLNFDTLVLQFVFVLLLARRRRDSHFDWMAWNFTAILLTVHQSEKIRPMSLAPAVLFCGGCASLLARRWLLHMLAIE